MNFEEVEIYCPYCEKSYYISDLDTDDILESDGDSSQAECRECLGIFEITLNIEVYCDIDKIQDPPYKNKSKKIQHWYFSTRVTQ